MSTYNCKRSINGIIVQNNPVNWIDPWGLQTVTITPPPIDALIRITTRAAELEGYYNAADRARRGCKTSLDDMVDEWIAAEKAAAEKADLHGTETESNKYQDMLDMLSGSESTIGAYANDKGAWGGAGGSK